MADKDEQLAQFQVNIIPILSGSFLYPSIKLQSITGCDAERAQFYLESSNWQLDLAMASFYEGDADQARPRFERQHNLYTNCFSICGVSGIIADNAMYMHLSA